MASASKETGVMRSSCLPLSSKSIYIDESGIAKAKLKRLECDLTLLGGIVEKFFTKGISYLITGHGTSDDYKRRGSNGAASSQSPFANTPSNHGTPQTPTEQTPSEQTPCKQSKDQPLTCSRASAMLERVKSSIVSAKKCSPSEQLVQNARQWGVAMLNPHDAAKWLSKKIAKLNLTPARGKSRVASVKSQVAVKEKVLRIPYIKIEDCSRLFRPAYKQLDASEVPVLNLGSTAGSPFELRLGIQHRENKSLTEDRDLQMDAVNGSKEKPRSKDIKNVRRNYPAEKKKMAFCMSCKVRFEDLVQHLRSDQHKAFVSNTSNFTAVDKLIASAPSMQQFLSNIHVYQPLSEPLCSESNCYGAVDLERREAAAFVTIDSLPPCISSPPGDLLHSNTTVLAREARVVRAETCSLLAGSGLLPGMAFTQPESETPLPDSASIVETGVQQPVKCEQHNPIIGVEADQVAQIPRPSTYTDSFKKTERRSIDLTKLSTEVEGGACASGSSAFNYTTDWDCYVCPTGESEVLVKPLKMESVNCPENLITDSLYDIHDTLSPVHQQSEVVNRHGCVECSASNVNRVQTLALGQGDGDAIVADQLCLPWSPHSWRTCRRSHKVNRTKKGHQPQWKGTPKKCRASRKVTSKLRNMDGQCMKPVSRNPFLCNLDSSLKPRVTLGSEQWADRVDDRVDVVHHEAERKLFLEYILSAASKFSGNDDDDRVMMSCENYINHKVSAATSPKKSSMLLPPSPKTSPRLSLNGRSFADEYYSPTKQKLSRGISFDEVRKSLPKLDFDCRDQRLDSDNHINAVEEGNSHNSVCKRSPLRAARNIQSIRTSEYEPVMKCIATSEPYVGCRQLASNNLFSTDINHECQDTFTISQSTDWNASPLVLYTCTPSKMPELKHLHLHNQEEKENQSSKSGSPSDQQKSCIRKRSALTSSDLQTQTSLLSYGSQLSQENDVFRPTTTACTAEQTESAHIPSVSTPRLASYNHSFGSPKQKPLIRLTIKRSGAAWRVSPTNASSMNSVLSQNEAPSLCSSGQWNNRNVQVKDVHQCHESTRLSAEANFFIRQAYACDNKATGVPNIRIQEDSSVLNASGFRSKRRRVQSLNTSTLKTCHNPGYRIIHQKRFEDPLEHIIPNLNSSRTQITLERTPKAAKRFLLKAKYGFTQTKSEIHQPSSN